MAIDTRDYYKDHHNKRDGYVEKSDFRISLAALRARRKRQYWLNFVLKVVCYATSIFFAFKMLGNVLRNL